MYRDIALIEPSNIGTIDRIGSMTDASQYPVSFTRHDYVINTRLLQLTSDLLNSLDLDTTLATMLHGTLALTQAQSGCVVLLDEQGMPLRWLLSDNHLIIKRSEVTAALYSDLIIRGTQPFVIPDTAHLEERAIALLPGRSLLVVPLHHDDTLIGVVLLAHALPRAFGTEHETLLGVAARPLAHALRNAAAHTELQAAAEIYEESKYKLIHDIRSPMMAVSASLEVIKRAIASPDSVPGSDVLIKESIEAGQRSLRGVLALSNDLLDTKRMQIGQATLEYETLELEFLFEDISKILYGLAMQRHVILRRSVNPRTLRINADPHRLNRMLVNLVSNAIRFSPEGGVVTLHASEDTEEQRVLLVVEDSGPGVPAEDRERIFDAFAQGQGEARRGSGLGLTVARDVAEAHQGRIWVEERPGGGSRFCVLLPSSPTDD